MTNDNKIDPETHNYWNHQLLPNSTINLNLTQSTETKTEDEKLSDGNKDMEVDNVKRVETSKYNVFAEDDDKKESLNKVEVASGMKKSRQRQRRFAR